jgi:trimethylamine:corrinoid methyltransferase-like protein
LIPDKKRNDPLINPGNPVVYCPALTAAYMKTGDYVAGPPEASLINIANLQQAL